MEYVVSLASYGHSLRKKWSFPLRISSVNMTKSAVSLIENLIFCAVIVIKWQSLFQIPLSEMVKSFERKSQSFYLLYTDDMKFSYHNIKTKDYMEF